MDENASRAVFLGVSVLVAIITLTVILNFYRIAKDTAAVANRHDITAVGNSRTNEILAKSKITGLELRYLLNYYSGHNDIEVFVYQPGDKLADMKNETPDNVKINFDAQSNLDEIIKPNYNYGLVIDNRNAKTFIVATFEN